MSLAVREVSVAKGYDPRDFALVASGGAGPLHVGARSPASCTSRRSIVPLFPSHFSALGMLLADERHDFIRTVYSDLASVDFATLADDASTRWSRKPTASLRHAQGRASARSISTCAMSARSSRCPVPVEPARSSKRGDRGGIRAAFDALYEHRYAHHSPDEPVEMVNIRLGAIGKRPKLTLPEPRRGRRRDAVAASARSISATPSKPLPCPVYRATRSAPAHEIAGPALIQEHGTTTVLFERDRLHGRAVRRADHHGGRRSDERSTPSRSK